MAKSEIQKLFLDHLNQLASEKKLNNELQSLIALLEKTIKHFSHHDLIEDGALVKVQWESDDGGPPKVLWWWILTSMNPRAARSFALNGEIYRVCDGSFGFGGSVLGMKKHENRSIHGDGRGLKDEKIQILEIL